MSVNELVENPADLLREVRENFIIQQDVDSLETIDKQVTQLSDLAKEKLNSNRIEISKYSSQLESQNLNVSTLNENLNRVKQESEQFVPQEELDRNLKDLEQLETRAKDLRKEMDLKISKLVKIEKTIEEATTIEETIDDLNDPITKANILKLKMYRSMGVIADTDNNQILIDMGNGELDILPLDNNLSGYFITKYIWGKMKQNGVQ